jgi:hypothetical protein
LGWEIVNKIIPRGERAKIGKDPSGVVSGGGCNRFGEISMMLLAVNAVFCSASGLLLLKMGMGCFGEFII